jgi:hypothetical protein
MRVAADTKLAGAVPSAFSFSCTACGKCCNSPPAMHLPELFRHQDRFIGCLAIQRVPRRRTGDVLRIGAHRHRLDEGDAEAWTALQDTLLYATGAGDAISLATQAFDYPSLARCPALENDGRCAIHDLGKPAMCEAVPLDPLLPDRLQHLVLAERSEADGFFGATCLQAGAGSQALVAAGGIADAFAREAVARRRAGLLADRRYWGDAVFASLRRELSADGWARLAPGGTLTLSLVPALLVIAGHSTACRARCLAYIDRQLVLIERSVGQALLRRRLEDRAVTQEMRGFGEAYRQARRVLLASAAPAMGGLAALAGQTEAWLGAGD